MNSATNGQKSAWRVSDTQKFEGNGKKLLQKTALVTKVIFKGTFTDYKNS